MKRNSGFVGENLLVALAAILLIGILGFFIVFKFETVQPHELAVVETWDGLKPEPVGPGTYMVKRFFVDYKPKSMGGQLFTMNDLSTKEEPVGEGRRFDKLEVKSKDNQEVLFSLSLAWHRDPAELVHQHKLYPKDIEELLIRPQLVSAFVTKATTLDALVMYSGPEFNDLRQSVEKALQAKDGALQQAGVVVDLLTLEKPTIPNKAYVDAIEGRQLAVIQKSQAEAQQSANTALAAAAQAKAQIALNETVVNAQAAKEKALLEQQAISEKAIIAANADAKNAVTTQTAESASAVIKANAAATAALATSEAAKQVGLNEAIVILAKGKSEAEAKKLALQAFDVKGADGFVKVEVAKSFGVAFSNVKGYLPSDAKYNIMAENFTKGVSLLVGGDAAASVAK